MLVGAHSFVDGIKYCGVILEYSIGMLFLITHEEGRVDCGFRSKSSLYFKSVYVRLPSVTFTSLVLLHIIGSSYGSSSALSV